MVTWRVQLTGDEAVLSDLASLLGRGETRVFHTECGYHLESAAFDGLETTPEVILKATSTTATFVGALRLQTWRLGDVRPSGVIYKLEDGKTSATFAVTHQTLELQTFVDAVLAGPEDAGPPPPPPVAKWVAIAATDPAAQRILDYLAKPDPGWHDLYCVLDVLEENGGNDVLEEAGISKKKVALFRRTACSYEAIGVKARHATTKHKPPTKPMSFGSAKSLIRKWVRVWLTTRG